VLAPHRENAQVASPMAIVKEIAKESPSAVPQPPFDGRRISAKATDTLISAKRSNWVEPGTSDTLQWLAREGERDPDDSRDGLKRGSVPWLPECIYYATIAPFLHFDAPQPGQLYAVGGRNQKHEPLDAVEMFDTWHGQWVQCPSMLARRAGCAASLLPDGQLLVVGGYDERGIVEGLLDSCELFDAAEQTWQQAPARLGRARWGHGCASMNGLVYAVGGCSLRPGAPPHEAFMETLRGCEVFDPAVGSWRPCSELHVARAGARVVALGDRYLAAVGGCDDVFGRAELLPTVELFDCQSERWALLDLQLSTPRTTAAVAALDDRDILIIGGAPSLSSAEVYRVPEVAATPEACVEAAAEDGEVAPLLAAAPPERTPLTGSSPSSSSSSSGPPQSVARKRVCDIAEGRMGCQAVALDLPATDGNFPLCTRSCIVVVGGENGDEDWEPNGHRHFSSVLVFDAEAEEWRSESYFPPIPTPRTAMALCVGPGRLSGHPL